MLVKRREAIMEENEVKILIDRLIHAFNTRDFESFFAYYTEDFDAFVGIQTPFLLEGKAAWKTFVEGLAAVPVALYTQRHTSYRIYNGNTVLMNGYFDFTTVSQDGQATTVNGRTRWTWVQVDARWLVAHAHYSRIFEGP